MRSVSFLLAATAILLTRLTPLHAVPVPRSVSTSRQIIVYGADVHLRGGVCDLAERIKRNALALLQKPDEWRTPILIDARYPAANNPEIPPASLRVSQTGFGLKIQLALRVGPDLSRSAIEREVLRALFLEIMYREEPNTPAGAPYVQPPEWLLEGTLALAGRRHDSSFIAEGLRESVASGEIISLEHLLRQQPGLLESPLRAVYGAYSAALVVTLTEMPNGPARLARFLVDLPRGQNDPVAELRDHFPALGATAEQLQKSWMLSVARLAASERYRLLGCEETERQLAEFLRVEVRAGEGRIESYALEEFPKFVHLPSSRNALLRLTEDLLLLSGQANPLYRPVVAEYQELAALLARGKTRKIPKRLAEIRATREHIKRRMSAIGDYMNWCEATQSPQPSGAFQEYLDVAQLLEKQKRHRRDPISVYLDALEAQLQN